MTTLTKECKTEAHQKVQDLVDHLKTRWFTEDKGYTVKAELVGDSALADQWQITVSRLVEDARVSYSFFDFNTSPYTIQNGLQLVESAFTQGVAYGIKKAKNEIRERLENTLFGVNASKTI